MPENENDFYVDEYGEIHLNNAAPQRLENDALWREYHQLEYEIFSHNDKNPEKLARTACPGGTNNVSYQYFGNG